MARETFYFYPEVLSYRIVKCFTGIMFGQVTNRGIAVFMKEFILLVYGGLPLVLASLTG